MKITQHGNEKDRFYMGRVRHNGRGLVFFGYSRAQVVYKWQRWRIVNDPVSPVRIKAKPTLRLVGSAA